MIWSIDNNPFDGYPVYRSRHYRWRFEVTQLPSGFCWRVGFAPGGDEITVLMGDINAPLPDLASAKRAAIEALAKQLESVATSVREQAARC